MSSDMGSPFVDTVSRFIGRHQLLHPGKKYLVALSGGADSVALLRVMRLLGYDIEAAHCNFRLRGEESDRDEAFCADLCHELSVPMHIVHFDTSAYATAHHLSIEMAARNLRYGYFRQLMNDIDAEAVVVAHHKDDSVETMLINLIRGTGIKGLTGISPKRDGVVRPLLCVDREQILSFLTHIHQDYVTDSTNLVDDVVRNKIRLKILPLMREINPSVTEAMAATAEKLSMVSAVYDSVMEELSGQARVPLADGKFIAYELGKITSEGLLFHILQPLGFSPKNVEEAYDAVQNRHTGAYFRSPSHEMVVDRELLVLMPVVKPFTAMNIPVTGRYVVSEDCLLNVKEVKVDGDFSIVRTPDCACLDAEKVALPLVLRTIEDGDRFSPLGMRGSKLVSDFLTDQKVNLLEKRRQLVVADAEGRIVWVVSRRPAHHCRITKDTKKAIVLKWETI